MPTFPLAVYASAIILSAAVVVMLAVRALP